MVCDLSTDFRTQTGMVFLLFRLVPTERSISWSFGSIWIERTAKMRVFLEIIPSADSMLLWIRMNKRRMMIWFIFFFYLRDPSWTFSYSRHRLNELFIMRTFIREMTMQTRMWIFEWYRERMKIQRREMAYENGCQRLCCGRVHVNGNQYRSLRTQKINNCDLEKETEKNRSRVFERAGSFNDQNYLNCSWQQQDRLLNYIINNDVILLALIHIIAHCKGKFLKWHHQAMNFS